MDPLTAATTFGTSLYAGVQSFANWIASPNNKPSITIKHLDPMCCLIRLGLLNYQEVEKKIKFEETRISFRDCGAYGNIETTVRGGGYLYLKYLKSTLNEATILYTPDEETEIGHALHVIFTKAILGLKRLKKTYEKTKKHYNSRDDALEKIQDLIDILAVSVTKKKKSEDEEEEEKVIKGQVTPATSRSHKVLWSGEDNSRKIVNIANQYILQDKGNECLSQIMDTLHKAEHKHQELAHKN